MDDAAAVMDRRRAVAAALREAIGRGEVSVEDVVEATGVTKETVGGWLVGIRFPPLPTTESLERLLESKKRAAG